MTEAVQQAWIDRLRSALEREGRRPLIEFLQQQRWFGGKGKSLVDVRLSDAIELSAGASPRMLAVLLVEYRGGVQERYMMPLSIRPRTDRDEAAITEMPEPDAGQWVCDATREDDVWRSLYKVVVEKREVAGHVGSVVGRLMPGRQKELAGPLTAVKVLSAEQSNTSVVFDRHTIMKLIRKTVSGINPDSEILEFLTTRTSCRDVPLLFGVVTYNNGLSEGAEPATVAVLQQFVPNRGDGWGHTLTHLTRLIDEGRMALNRGDDPGRAIVGLSASFFSEARRLGEVTGSLHTALASDQESESFCPEPITAADIERWREDMVRDVKEVFHDLRGLPQDQLMRLVLTVAELDELEQACLVCFNALTLLSRHGTAKIRYHGDYHLGQVLKTQEGFVVIDFEGEPMRPLEERRAKGCPLKDVGGMLRSFNYAFHAALKEQPSSSQARSWLVGWEQEVRASFLDGYLSVARPGKAAFLPPTVEDVKRVMRVFELDKAAYELRYELHNRPEWLSIPLQGIRRFMQEHTA